MNLQLHTIHWSIWKSLASRKKGFWQFALRKRIKPNKLSSHIEKNAWKYYKRTKVGGKGDTPISNNSIESNNNKWLKAIESLNHDPVIFAITPITGDLIQVNINNEILYVVYNDKKWDLISEEFALNTSYKNWIAYSGSIKQKNN